MLKNKEEGTELFKGQNYRPAAARYNKALTHAAKFVDLSPEQKKEVGANPNPDPNPDPNPNPDPDPNPNPNPNPNPSPNSSPNPTPRWTLLR